MEREVTTGIRKVRKINTVKEMALLVLDEWSSPHHLRLILRLWSSS